MMDMVKQRVKYTVKHFIGKPFISSKDKVLRMVKEHEIISFDLFDTLVKRQCGRPENIFKIIEEEYFLVNNRCITGFQNERIQAEHKARVRANKQEVTIEDIYEETDYSKEEQQQLAALEEETELTQCITKSEMIDIFEYAKKNRRIIITTDMYLHEKTIYQIMHNNKIEGFEKLYLSNKYGVTKCDGELYKQVRNDYCDCRILHIGDNIKVDYIMAKKNGIDACLIQ